VYLHRDRVGIVIQRFEEPLWRMLADHTHSFIMFGRDAVHINTDYMKFKVKQNTQM